MVPWSGLMAAFPVTFFTRRLYRTAAEWKRLPLEAAGARWWIVESCSGGKGRKS
jgi:hypothetical protein